MQLVGVSEWVSERARQEILGRFPIRTIWNPVDTATYRPIGQQLVLRDKYGIPRDARTIVFSIAGKAIDKRKGIDLILQALERLQLEHVYLILLGITDSDGTVEAQLDRYPHRPFENVSDSTQLNELLNAADLLWHPSRADNLPLMPLEAFAAGTPAVAADVGGVGEIVRHGETGYLIPPNDAASLARQTEAFFSLPLPAREQMGAAARARTERYFALDRFLAKHESLYHAVSGDTPNGQRS